MIHTMLPIQYLQNAGGRLAEPEKRLGPPGPQTVIYDCRTVEDPHVDGPARARDHQAYGRAMAYVASRDRDWPSTFENLCDPLGVDAGHPRRGITQRQIVAA